MSMILLTGSRYWKDMMAVAEVVKRHHDDLLIVGDCPTGLDDIAAALAYTSGTKFAVFKADWNRHGSKAGPMRNQEMVDQKPDKAYAFIMALTQCKGTQDCISRCKKAGIPVEVIFR